MAVLKVLAGGMATAAAVALQASPALAQPAPAIHSVDEVVVTAERSDRTLRDTATSVAVMTGRDIERTGVQTTYDVLTLIPHVGANRTSNNAPAIRGIDGGGPAIGANAFLAGTRPRVAFLVDGRPLTFNEVLYLDGGIWDAQQIEVYRGPQSTLQGRNAIGGVIAVKTADPTFTYEGKARAIVGDDNLRQVSGAVGGPLIDNVLAFRLAADYRAENAFVTLPPYPQLAHPEHYRSKMIRGKLLFTPTQAPGLRSLLTVSYTDAFAPQTLSVKQPFGDYYSSTAMSPRFRTRALVGISDTTWRLNDLVSVSSFLTASDFRVNRYINPGSGIAQIDGDEYSIEPRIRLGQATDTLSGFVAAYLFNSHQREFIDLFGGGRFHDMTVTRAVFGEATWRPTDRFDLTLGARYEQEDRDRTGGAGIFRIDYHKTFEAFLPRATASWKVDPQTTVGLTVGRGYNAGGAGFAFNPPFPSFTFDKETVWNYEAFLRSDLLDGRLNLRANAFYNAYSDLQLPFVVAQSPTGPATVIRNADRAITYGAEVEARFAVTPKLDLKATAGLLKTDIDRYDDPNVEGNPLPRSPAFSATVGAFARPLDNVDLALDVRYTDAYESDVFSSARGKTKPYTLVNAQAGYTFGKARVFIQATNLLDEKTPVLLMPVVDPAADLANMTRPRRVMGGIELAF